MCLLGKHPTEVYLEVKKIRVCRPTAPRRGAPGWEARKPRPPPGTGGVGPTERVRTDGQEESGGRTGSSRREQRPFLRTGALPPSKIPHLPARCSSSLGSKAPGRGRASPEAHREPRPCPCVSHHAVGTNVFGDCPLFPQPGLAEGQRIWKDDRSFFFSFANVQNYSKI